MLSFLEAQDPPIQHHHHILLKRLKARKGTVPEPPRVLRTTVLWETFLKYQGWLVSSWECEWHSLQLAIACVKYNVSVIFLLPLLLFSLLSLP